MVPRGALPRDGQAALGAAVRPAAAPGSARAATTRRSPGMHDAGRDGRRRLAPGDRGDPARRRRARVPPGRRAPPRDARPGVGVLHLRRPGARDRPGAARRAARPVPRLRRPPRRRRPGDPLGRPGRADGLVPRVRALPVPGERLPRRARGGGGGRDRGQRAAGARDRRGGVARRGPAAASPSWPPRSGRTSSSASTAPIRTRGTRSRTCA